MGIAGGAGIGLGGGAGLSIGGGGGIGIGGGGGLSINGPGGITVQNGDLLLENGNANVGNNLNVTGTANFACDVYVGCNLYMNSSNGLGTIGYLYKNFTTPFYMTLDLGTITYFWVKTLELLLVM